MPRDVQSGHEHDKLWCASASLFLRSSSFRLGVVFSASLRQRIDVADESANQTTVTWPGPLQTAQKFPLTESLFREQFGRLGDTPFELGAVRGLEKPSLAMIPKSVLNDLRREATKVLLEKRAGDSRAAILEPDVLAS